MANQYQYKAFISYSHDDERLAKWLHRSLERYKIPKRIVEANNLDSGRIAPIFRDREELGSASSLPTKIDHALAASEFLLVVCSPSAAESRWVNKEVNRFIRMGRQDQILCLIVAGEPPACFPAELRKYEPLAADSREHGDGKAEAKLKVISGLLGIDLGKLRQRDLRRRQQRLLAISAGIATVLLAMATLTTLAILARQDALREAETSERATDVLAEIFSISDPGQALGNTITAREILDKGVEKIEQDLIGQPELQVTMLEKIGGVYISLGLYEEAEVQLLRARDIAIEIYAPSDPRYTKIEGSLGKLYYRSSRHEEAEQLLLSVLSRDIDSFGKTHPRVAQLLNQLAGFYTAQDRLEVALEYAQESLDIRRTLFGEASTEYARTLITLATITRELGEFDQSLAYAKQALSIYDEKLPSEHPNVAGALQEISINLSEQGFLQEQEPYALRVLEIDEKVYGPNHEFFATSLENVGILYAKQGKFEQAEQYFIRSLSTSEAALGPVHDSVAFKYYNLGYLYKDMGHVGKAESHLQKSIEIWTKVFDAEHGSNAWAWNGLAEVYLEQRNFARARDSATRSLEINEHNYGRDHQNTADSILNLANINREDGQFEVAKLHYDRALTITESRFGRDGPRTIAVLEEYLLLLSSAGLEEEALTIEHRLNSHSRQ